jgi:hypothetical protein
MMCNAPDVERGTVMRLWRWLLGTVVAVGIAAGAVWGFLETGAEREAEQPIGGPRRVSNVNGETVVTLSVEAQHANGLETTVLRTVHYRQQLRAFGTVLDLEPLTNLSNSYVAALSARQTAQARLEASKAAFERAKALYKFQGASMAQAEAAEATFRSDEASVAAAESHLSTLATTAQQTWGPTLAHGMIDRTPMFIRLIERRSVLVQVTLPPGMAMAHPPATAFVELAGGSRAPLDYVSPATKTDPRIQGLSFFYTAEAETQLLPGMSVVVFVPSDTAIDGVTVPGTSIVWWHGRAWIYLRRDPDHFARREIATNMPTPQGGYVAPRLADGSEVVTQGAQMLFSEEQKAQAGQATNDE